MTNKYRHKQIERIKKKYKHLAAIVAGAAILSSPALPGIPAAIAHASAKPPITQQAEQSQETQPPAQETQTKTQEADVPANYKQTLDIVATAYAPGPHDNDQWGNKTYAGTQVRPGIIAVDPRIIPIGSHVFIKYPDGHGEYAVAEDTGGAIKGNRIDVAKWTVKEAENFGVKNVKVFILDTPEKAK